MLTLSTLRSEGRLKRWELATNGLNDREFYYTPAWSRALAALPGGDPSKLFRGTVSPNAKVSGLLDAFVQNVELKRLGPPMGYGGKPPFKRMHKRHDYVPLMLGASLAPFEAVPFGAVVELVTIETRTFGFFACENVFVGVILERTENLKINGKSIHKKYDECANKVRSLLCHLDVTCWDAQTDVENLVTC